MSQRLIDRVRAKFPQYADVPDDRLTLAIGEKYPQYLEQDGNFARTFDAYRQMRLNDADTAARTSLAGQVGAAVEAGLEGVQSAARTVDRELIAPLTGGTVDQWASAVPEAASLMLRQPVREAGKVFSAAGRLLGDEVDTITRMTGLDPAGPVARGLRDVGETAPVLAASMGLQRLGVNPAVAFGAPPAVQTYGETGDVAATLKAGATGALIPAVAQAGKLGGAALNRALIERNLLSPAANATQKAVEVLGSQGAVQVFMEGLRLPEYAALDPEARREAIYRNLVANTAFLAMDLPTFKRSVPSETLLRMAPAERVAYGLRDAANNPELVDALQRTADELARQATLPDAAQVEGEGPLFRREAPLGEVPAPRANTPATPDSANTVAQRFPGPAADAPGRPLDPFPTDQGSGETVRAEGETPVDRFVLRELGPFEWSDNLMRKRQAERDQFKAQVGEVTFEAPATKLADERNAKIVISPEPGQSGKWRYSIFDKDGASSHATHPSWDAAVKEAHQDFGLDLSNARIAKPVPTLGNQWNRRTRRPLDPFPTDQGAGETVADGKESQTKDAAQMFGLRSSAKTRHEFENAIADAVQAAANGDTIYDPETDVEWSIHHHFTSRGDRVTTVESGGGKSQFQVIQRQNGDRTVSGGKHMAFGRDAVLNSRKQVPAPRQNTQAAPDSASTVAQRFPGPAADAPGRPLDPFPTDQGAVETVEAGGETAIDQMLLDRRQNKFREKAEAIRARRDAWINQTLDQAGERGSLEYVSTERPDRTLIVSPVPGQPGRWRTTQFDANVPIGHYEFDSREQAIRAVGGEHHTKKIAGPSYFGTGEYVLKRSKERYNIAADGRPLDPFPTDQGVGETVAPDAEWNVVRMGRKAEAQPSAKGTEAVAQRMVNAEEGFLEFAMQTAGLTREQAVTALAEYRKAKAIKIDPVGGQFSFTHGGFAQAEVLRRAAGIAAEPPQVPAAQPGQQPEAAAEAGVVGLVNPFDTSATSRRLTELQATRPRPKDKLFGKSGGTKEQRDAHDAQVRQWNSDHRKAQKAHREMVEKSNEWIRSQKSLTKPADVRPAEPGEQPAPPAEAAPAMQGGMDNLRFTSEPVERRRAGKGRPLVPDAKDAKAKLIAELEKAVAAAQFENEAQVRRMRQVLSEPPEEKFKTVTDKNMGAGWQDRYRAEYEEAKRAFGGPGREIPKVTIEIPGDGTFTVVNTKENLRGLLARAKRLETGSGTTSKAPVARAPKMDVARVIEDARKVYGDRKAVEILQRQAEDQLLEMEPKQRALLAEAALRLKNSLPPEAPEPKAEPKAKRSADTGKPAADQVFATLKKAYPFSGIKTLTEAKSFVAKAKRLLKPLGIAPDMVDRAVERGRTQGGKIYYPSDESIYRELARLGYLEEPIAEGGSSGTAGSPRQPQGTFGLPAIPAGTATAVPSKRMVVTMERLVPGFTTVAKIEGKLSAIVDVARGIADASPIRSNRLSRRFAGVYTTPSRVVRMWDRLNLPTTAHEVAHALADAIFGTAASRGLRGIPPSVGRELVRLGRNLYGNTRPNAGYAAEGWAELVADYLTTDDIARRAPQATQWLENTVLPAFPEVARALREARAEIDVWRGMGARERMRAQTAPHDSKLARLRTELGRYVGREGLVEQFAPFEALSRRFRQVAGRDLAADEDPFLIASARRGQAGSILAYMADEGMIDPSGNRTGGRSLREALAPVTRGLRPDQVLARNQRAADFWSYLWARRAIERWGLDRNPGISLADAQYLRQTLETPDFQLAASRYYQWWDGVLDYLAASSPANRELVARIRAGSKDYVPLARMLDPNQTRPGEEARLSNALRRMRGSSLPVRMLDVQTLLTAESLIARAHRDQVMEAVFRLANQPGMGAMIEEVPRSQVQEVVNIERLRAQLEGMGVDTTGIPADTLLEYYTGADAPGGSDPIVARRVNGEVRWYYVRPDLYAALEGIQPARLPLVADLLLGVPARLFRLGTTGLRPAFSLFTNPVRDIQTFLMQSTAGVNPLRRVAQYFGALGDIVRSGMPGAAATPYRDLFDRLGIMSGQPLGGDIGYARREARGLFHGRVFKRVTAPVETLRELLSFSEATPRIAELRLRAQEMGWAPGQPLTPAQAIQLTLAAKRVTTDFSASGSYARLWSQAVPFLNASIQGTRGFLRAMRERPLQATLYGVSMFTLPALWTWWHNKDEEWYQALPWRERYLYWNVPDENGQVYQIPRPPEWNNAFAVIPEALMDAAYRDNPDAVKAAFGHIFATTNPFDLPVLARIAWEQARNRVDFFDRPIVPRAQVDLRPGEQVGPYTSWLATSLGKAFPETISPRRVDHLLRGVGGGTASDTLSAIEQMAGLKAGALRSEPSETPVVGRALRRGGQFSAVNRQLADLYDLHYYWQARARNKELAPELAAYARYVDDQIQMVKFGQRVAEQTDDLKARQSLYRDLTRQAESMLTDAKRLKRLPAQQ